MQLQKGASSLTCLTMHQPWASLLVYGIKRIEGRTWSTEHRGSLWIHAAGKQPSQEDIDVSYIPASCLTRLHVWYPSQPGSCAAAQAGHVHPPKSLLSCYTTCSHPEDGC